MSNKTQPTPEQLAQWREVFESFYSDDREYLLTRDKNSGDYVNETVDSGWWGYLRAKQENEHVLKLAKFCAGLIRDGYFDFDDAVAHGLMSSASGKFKPEIEATIEELLK